jgi:hypothetical protein
MIWNAGAIAPFLSFSSPARKHQDEGRSLQSTELANNNNPFVISFFSFGNKEVSSDGQRGGEARKTWRHPDRRQHKVGRRGRGRRRDETARSIETLMWCRPTRIDTPIGVETLARSMCLALARGFFIKRATNRKFFRPTRMLPRSYRHSFCLLSRCPIAFHRHRHGRQIMIMIIVYMKLQWESRNTPGMEENVRSTEANKYRTDGLPFFHQQGRRRRTALPCIPVGTAAPFLERSTEP